MGKQKWTEEYPVILHAFEVYVWRKVYRPQVSLVEYELLMTMKSESFVNMPSKQI